MLLQQYLPFTVLKPTMLIAPHQYVLCWLQQYLPFTVLKPSIYCTLHFFFIRSCNSTYRLRYWNCSNTISGVSTPIVATVLTVYGIETDSIENFNFMFSSCNSTYRLRYWNTSAITPFFLTTLMLQQYLPFTVLKQIADRILQHNHLGLLQQYLPFTVLKQAQGVKYILNNSSALQQYLPFTVLKQLTIDFNDFISIGALQQYLPFTVLKLLWTEEN